MTCLHCIGAHKVYLNCLKFCYYLSKFKAIAMLAILRNTVCAVQLLLGHIVTSEWHYNQGGLSLIGYNFGRSQNEAMVTRKRQEHVSTLGVIDGTCLYFLCVHFQSFCNC